MWKKDPEIHLKVINFLPKFKQILLKLKVLESDFLFHGQQIGEKISLVLWPVKCEVSQQRAALSQFYDHLEHHWHRPNG